MAQSETTGCARLNISFIKENKGLKQSIEHRRQPCLFLSHADKRSAQAGGQGAGLEIKNKDALPAMLRIASSALRNCGMLQRVFNVELEIKFIF